MLDFTFFDQESKMVWVKYLCVNDARPRKFIRLSLLSNIGGIFFSGVTMTFNKYPLIKTIKSKTCFSSSCKLPSEMSKEKAGQVVCFSPFSISNTIKQMRHYVYCIHTPGNVGVSSKNVLTFSDYSNSVWFPITVAVECTCSPAVRGGAVTKLPNM